MNGTLNVTIFAFLELGSFCESKFMILFHYTKYNIEPIVFLMKNKLEYWRGSIIKYACRAGSKFQEGKSMEQSELDDLNKILEYVLFRKRQLKGENIVLGESKDNEAEEINCSTSKKS